LPGVDGTVAEVLTPDEALGVLGGGVDLGAVSPLGDRPFLAVHLSPGPALDRLAALTGSVAGVTVGVRDEAEPGPEKAAFDVVVRAGEELDLLTAAVTRNPQASGALVRVLRAGAHLPRVETLTLESFAYATLQAGGEHHRWLAAQPSRPVREPSGPAVRAERDGGVLTVTLNRPEVRNALDVTLRDGLVAALGVAADAGIVAVHLRGAGPCFCSGGDLTEFGTTPDPATGDAVRATRSAAAALARVSERLTVHVHGACVGAGVELAAFARRVVARPGTTFRLPEVGMGLIPGSGGTVSLPARIGRQRTAWLALSGAAIDADHAREWGLVDAIEA
jgi:hypothetical protein